jgi:5-methylthioribose kinase
VKPEFALLGPIVAYVGVILIANLLYLMSHQPVREETP